MDKLFLTVLNMSLTGAFVIAAVILARIPLKKAPKIISYCLWAVVGFRLICPFAIDSPFSLIPFETEQVTQDELAFEAEISFFEAAAYSMQFPDDDTYVPIRNPDLVDIDNAPYNGIPMRYLFGYEAYTILLRYLWPIGVAAMLLYGIISYVLLKRRMRTAIRIEGNIYEMDSIQSPFVLGIIKPKIYLPLSLAVSERKYIILHERTHIRRHDHIVKFGAYFILCLHWFNPLVWLAFLLMGVDMEMSCDERVLKEMGGDTKHDYSRSLLSLATQRRVIGGSPLAFGEGGVKERVKNVLNFRKPSLVIIVAAVALAAVLIVGLATNEQRNAEVRTLTIADFEKIEVGASHTEVRSILGQPIGLLSGLWGDIYESDDGTKVIIYYDDFGNVGRINFENPDPITVLVNTVSIIVWKDTDNKTRYSLFDGEVTSAPSELSSGRVFNDTAELNTALAAYPQDTLSVVHVDHTLDFTKEEMISITEQFIIPSGNYSMATGLYEFHITTLAEAREIVGEHYPGWPDITFVGEDTINYTNPPKPIEVYKFEVAVSGLFETCAVSKERGIFFTYSDDTWWAFTGLAEWNGATKNMTFNDVRAIAQKIGADLTMGDLRDFIGTDVGSGIFVMRYEIVDSDYVLLVGSGNMTDVSYAYLLPHSGAENEESIDIRYYDVDKFLANGTRMPVRPLPGASGAPQEDIYELIQRVENSLSIIMSSPLTSSNPQDYINEHWEEYENLSAKYSDGVLEYLLSEFESGNSDGLRGQIMMRICKDILGLSNNVTDESLSPQKWYSQLSVISQTWLPDFVPDNPEGEYGELAYSAITQFYSQLDYGFLVSAPTVYGAYEEEGKLKIFMTVYYQRYRLFGKTLESIGGGVIPGAAIFRKNESNGAWIFEEYLEVGSATLPDGMYFNDSIQKLCVMPVSGREIKGLAKKMSDDYINDARQELLSQNLIKHLLSNNQAGVSLRTPGGEMIPLT